MTNKKNNKKKKGIEKDCPGMLENIFFRRPKAEKTPMSKEKSPEEPPKEPEKIETTEEKERRKERLKNFLNEAYEIFVTSEIFLLFYRHKYIMVSADKIAEILNRKKDINKVENILDKLVEEEILEKIGGSGPNSTYCLNKEIKENEEINEEIEKLIMKLLESKKKEI